MLAPVRLYLLGAPVAELEDVRTLLQHVVARVCGVEAAYVQVPHLSGPVCYNSEWNRAGGASLAASRPGKLLMEMWTARITFPGPDHGPPSWSLLVRDSAYRDVDRHARVNIPPRFEDFVVIRPHLGKVAPGCVLVWEWLGLSSWGHRPSQACRLRGAFDVDRAGAAREALMSSEWRQIHDLGACFPPRAANISRRRGRSSDAGSVRGLPVFANNFRINDLLPRGLVPFLASAVARPMTLECMLQDLWVYFYLIIIMCFI